MSYTWFTADTHFGHGNIIKYSGRPFKTAEEMNTALINNWNARVGRRDTVFFLGDFCCVGKERGVEGLRKTAEEWEALLHGKIVFIAGNHDHNNTVKHMLNYASYPVTRLLQAFLIHRPNDRDVDWGLVPEELVLCGHVHEKWKVKHEFGKTFINVGVDQNSFMPWRADEIAEFYYKAKKQQNQ